jgi:hypothetical protein
MCLLRLTWEFLRSSCLRINFLSGGLSPYGFIVGAIDRLRLGRCDCLYFAGILVNETFIRRNSP